MNDLSGVLIAALGFLAFFVVVMLIAIPLRKRNIKKYGHIGKGKHIIDFMVSNTVGGFITEELHLCATQQVGSLVHDARLLDLNLVTYVGALESHVGKGHFSKIYNVQFLNANNKKIGSSITLSNKKEVEDFFDIIRQHVPHIEVGKIV